MLAVVLGLAGAILYGAADFFGGLSARRISALRVTALVAVSGLVFLLIGWPIIGGAWSWSAVLLGALSGVTGAAAIGLLYACLAIGPMSILSPLTALVSAIVPLSVGIARGESLGPIGWAAIGVALIAVILVGFIPDERAVRPTGRALLMAVGSGILIGTFFVIIDFTPDNSGLVPLLANRTANATVLFITLGILALARRARGTGAAGGEIAGRGTPSGDTRETAVTASGTAGGASAGGTAVAGRWAPGIRLAIIGGFADAGANLLLLYTLREGGLSIAAVLTAMYPAGTILLAAIVLRERIAPSQWVGLALAIVAAGMLALA